MTKARKRPTPTHCLHKGKNLMYVRLNGRQLYTGRPGSKEAEAAYHRLLAEWHAKDGEQPSGPCVVSISDQGAFEVGLDAHQRRKAFLFEDPVG